MLIEELETRNYESQKKLIELQNYVETLQKESKN
jgi:hypothetical protein